jgi:hypothetical protein
MMTPNVQNVQCIVLSHFHVNEKNRHASTCLAPLADNIVILPLHYLISSLLHIDTDQNLVLLIKRK